MKKEECGGKEIDRDEGGEVRIEGNVEREGGWSRGRKESEGEGGRGGE